MTIDISTLIEKAVQFNLGVLTIGTMTMPVFMSTTKGGWKLQAILGPMNPWLLGVDGIWRYKAGSTFPSREAAIEALNASIANPKWDGQ